MGRSVSVAILLGGAIAFPSFAASPTDSTSPQDVPVDTKPAGSESTSTNPESAPSSTTPGRSTSIPQANSRSRFTCENNNGQYTVMYHPESQPNQSYPWAVPQALGGGWTPALRCNEISRRLELYRPDGLIELRTAMENNYNIICVTTEKNSDCRIVLTVPPGQDPLVTRDRVFQNLTVADSGQSTQGVNTFADRGQSGNLINQVGQLLNLNLPSLGLGNQRGNSINLRPFLDRRDGGTGVRLQGGVSTRSGPQLRPENFR